MTKLQIAVLRMYEQKRVLESRLNTAIKCAFPLNSEVSFKRGRGEIVARIVAHSYGERIKILNVNTGKQYWVYAYDLLNQE